MKFNIITLFPEIYPGPLNHSIIGNALANKTFSIETFNIRDFSESKHKSVDDKPFGGGAGMVIKAEVIQKTLEFVRKKIQSTKTKIICFSPRGKRINQSKIKEILNWEEIIMICGRYEGIDQRFIDYNNIEELSIGDFVLSCGDFASFILIDACVRLIPEVLGNKKSLNFESFEDNLLEYPQYTKPSLWKGIEVPEILLSGDHRKIDEWRKKKAHEITKKTRPDLWKLYKSSRDKKK